MGTLDTSQIVGLIKSLIEIAVGMPEYHFEIIGHSEPQNLDLPENLQILGPKSHPEINKLRKWKAAIIPFKTGPLSDAVDLSKFTNISLWVADCIFLNASN